MKKTAFIILLVGIVLSVSIDLFAQSETSMTPILTEGTLKILEIEGSNNTIVRMEYDLVHDGSAKSTYRKMFNTRTYKFMAFGDSKRVGDVDIKIYRKVNGELVLVAQDTSNDAVAKVEFTPTENDQYQIDIRAYEFKSGYTASHYGLIIYHE